MNLKTISYCILVMGSMKGVKVTSQCVVKYSTKVILGKSNSSLKFLRFVMKYIVAMLMEAML